MAQKQWFGATDYKTANSYFSYDKDHSDGRLSGQFDALVKRLKELSGTLDGNGRAVVQWVFSAMGPEQPNQVVAYRFTSDWAHDHYNDQLVKMGGSLARGVWRPFADTACESHRLVMEAV